MHYTAKVAITADTTLKYAAFDPTGNVSLIGQQDYVITNKPTPRRTDLRRQHGRRRIDHPELDQTIVRKVTATTVTLTGAGSTPDATYSWEQVLTGPTDPDKVTLTGATTLSPIFSLATDRYPMTNSARTFRLTVTPAVGVPKTDDVNVTPKADTVAIATARWKLGDFRVTGVGSVAGGAIILHKGSLSGPSYGTFAMTAAPPPATGGVFRARSALTAAPFNVKPGTVWIESSLGGTAGPFTVG